MQTMLAVPVSIIVMAAIPPKTYSVEQEKYPYNDPEFKRGYEKQMRKEKKKAALKGFIIGILADVATVALFSE
jgi:hypothetical protein